MYFGRFNQDDNQPMAEINTTPLVDVMLVLLVVFMVTMPLITNSIPLNLPQSSNKTESLSTPEPMRVSIDAQGGFYMGAEKRTPQALAKLFEATAQKNRETIVAIAADKKVEYKYVVQMLTLAQDAGLSKVGFLTEAE